jgi:hypothetical protein
MPLSFQPRFASLIFSLSLLISFSPLRTTLIIFGFHYAAMLITPFRFRQPPDSDS